VSTQKVLKRDGILAWHFTAGMKLRDGTPLVVGRTYRHNGALDMCRSGLHASRDPYDALMFAPGSTLSLVLCWGDVEHGDDKLVCSRRTVLATRDVLREASMYAFWCVRQVWHLLTDERSRTAVVTAEKYARGEATQEELAAARDAAWDAAGAAGGAAWDAARYAAWAAAWAAYGAAAWDAARYAAWDAAWEAYGAAGGAAWDAARYAAWDAAREAQRAEFARVISATFADDLTRAQAREGGR